MRIFVELLENMGITEEQLFCISMPGFWIPEGNRHTETVCLLDITKKIILECNGIIKKYKYVISSGVNIEKGSYDGIIKTKIMQLSLFWR